MARSFDNESMKFWNFHRENLPLKYEFDPQDVNFSLDTNYSEPVKPWPTEKLDLRELYSPYLRPFSRLNPNDNNIDDVLGLQNFIGFYPRFKSSFQAEKSVFEDIYNHFNLDFDNN